MKPHNITHPAADLSACREEAKKALYYASHSL